MTDYRATTAPQTSHHTSLSTLSVVVVSTIAPEEEAKAEDLALLVGEAFTSTLALLQVPLFPLFPLFLQTLIIDQHVRSVANQGIMLFDAGIASTTAIS